MNHSDKCSAISFIRPNAQFTLRGDDLEWLDETQIEPTESEIEQGWMAYQAAQKAKAEAQAQAKAELFERLGITAEEASLLLS